MLNNGYVTMICAVPWYQEISGLGAPLAWQSKVTLLPDIDALFTGAKSICAAEPRKERWIFAKFMLQGGRGCHGNFMLGRWVGRIGPPTAPAWNCPKSVRWKPHYSLRTRSQVALFCSLAGFVAKHWNIPESDGWTLDMVSCEPSSFTVYLERITQDYYVVIRREMWENVCVINNMNAFTVESTRIPFLCDIFQQYSVPIPRYLRRWNAIRLTRDYPVVSVVYPHCGRGWGGESCLHWKARKKCSI